jgi:hypothetical protein
MKASRRSRQASKHFQGREYIGEIAVPAGVTRLCEPPARD